MAGRLDTQNVNELGLSVEGSAFAPLIRRVQRELRANGIALAPVWYLSDSYGCVVDTCNIGLKWVEAIGMVPALGRRFAHLLRPPDRVLMTLRHELGHAFCYVHRLYRLKEFRRIFEVRGDYYGTYPDDGWHPSPADRGRFATGRYLNLHCTKHPDDDFANTFQHWLAPGSDWEARHAGRDALLAKLRYVGRLVRRYGARPYKTDPRDLDLPIEGMAFNAVAHLRREKIHAPGSGFA
jgi:hypothetical protein